MHKTWIIRASLLIGYCVPFSFLCVNGDAVSGTMFWYGIMITGLALLCRIAIKTNNVPILCIGNALSLASSCAAAKLTGLAPMGHYFKPFTSTSLMVVVSIAAIFLQAVCVLICEARKRRSVKGV